jgi:hypothetical protein
LQVAQHHCNVVADPESLDEVTCNGIKTSHRTGNGGKYAWAAYAQELGS